MQWWGALWLEIGSLFGGFTNWWNTLNIGNLSEALAAAGGLAVVVTTLWLTRREARRNAVTEALARVDAEELSFIEAWSSANAVNVEVEVTWVAPPEIPEAYPNDLNHEWFRFVVSNHSNRPVSRVGLLPVAPSNENPADVDRKDWMALWQVDLIPPGGREVADLDVTIMLGKNPSDLGSPGVAVRFTDVNQLTWWKTRFKDAELIDRPQLNLTFYEDKRSEILNRSSALPIRCFARIRKWWLDN